MTAAMPDLRPSPARTSSLVTSARRLGLLTALALAPTLTLLGEPTPAQAFCGFYVAGADQALFNNATVVVMMRDGTRTVLSMQNNYQGPPEDFAMIVPVPVVLQEGDVKTLERGVFDRVDQLAAPRLVEYWEQDPCAVEHYERERRSRRGRMKSYEMAVPSVEAAEDYHVTIEAEFTVAEYDIVILSAEDASGLDRWLNDSGYKIPQGAEPLLRPYVQQGMKFFVAKVDAQKVQFGPNGQAMLSPLRFHYDSEDFVLPVRLGLINANGAQDLLIHILARHQRYELANYENVTIPTNLEVKDETREHFGQFYASLFDHTLEQNPKAVVTEYAWAAGSCDPCPVEPLSGQELRVLGADALPELRASYFDEQGNMNPGAEYSLASEFTLTRLHARYDKASLGEDLVFRTATPIVGGREFLQTDGVLERGAVPSEYGGDNFQARYIIRHYWEGAVRCANPTFGNWGGPTGTGTTEVARDLAFVERGAKLQKFVQASAHAELGLDGPAPASPVTHLAKRSAAAENPPSSGDGCRCSVDDRQWGLGALASLGMFGLLGLGLRRRKQTR